MKRCSSCHTDKELSKFHKDRAGSQGRANRCVECAHQYYRETHGKDRKPHQKDPTARTCKTCNETKPVAEFYKRKSGYYESSCRLCKTNLSYVANIGRYGITAEQYEALLTKQNQVCAICHKSDTKRLSIDHDHACCPGSTSCGKCVRGLLCSRCNSVLGMVEDSPELLAALARYLG